MKRASEMGEMAIRRKKVADAMQICREVAFWLREMVEQNFRSERKKI